MTSDRRVVVLQHASTEGPQRLAELFEEAGVAVEVCALDRGEPVPRSLPADVPLVVMGGSMGVSDIGDPAHPYLADEVVLLRARLAEDAPVLGVCLGSQLLAHAAGARVYPNSRPDPGGGAPARVYEVGWAPVDFLAPAEPALHGLGAREMMLHWHGDAFDLPRGAVRLASTPDCPNQAFRLGRHAFGVQFHPEMHAPVIETWLDADAAWVERACGPGAAGRIRAELPGQFPAYATARDRLLRNLVRCLVER
jgi:GMP synthase-like glutamine amidotransferase